MSSPAEASGGATPWSSRVRRVWVQSNAQLYATLVIIVSLWTFGWLPNVVNMVFRGRVSVQQRAEVIPDTPAAVVTIGIIYVAIVSSSAVALVGLARRDAHRRLLPLFLCLLPAILELTVSNPLNGIFLQRPQVVTYSLVATSLWLIGPHRLIIKAIATISGATALVGIIMGIAGVGTLSSDLGVITEKAILFPELLSGPYVYNNFLGLAIATGSPLLLLLHRRSVAIACTILIAVATVWSGSRTALLALIIGAVVLTLLFLMRDRQIAKWAASALLVGIGLLTIGVPLVFRNRADSFSYRGTIWNAVLSEWSASPWFGLGRDLFSPESHLVDAVRYYVSHGHNFFITVLGVGGIFGLASTVLLLSWIGIVAVRAISWSPVPYVFLIVTLATGIFETPTGAFPFERPNTTSYIVWPLFAMACWAFDQARFRQVFELADWARFGAYRQEDLQSAGLE